ncbi:spondin domain-containing protein [Aliikangiella sp. IMCC44359]|uniref:spondin domain-containing protein n=1 Tax=Aliikangiella sp. IMCC44359 TaxID=3459125 RepID=UPI00403ABB39
MKVSQLLLASSLAITSPLVSAQQLDITISNLTNGIHFTPFVVAGHDMNTHIFKVGQAASSELQMLAEGGNISGVVGVLNAANAVVVKKTAGGLLTPGTNTQLMLDTGTNEYLSLSSMLLPTNDGFAGIDSWKIPTEPGVYWINVNAYDAGTEANDEIINGGGASNAAGIPAAPGMDGGTNGTGVATTDANQTVHVHRGNLGDDQPTAGKSDLDNRIHRWLNPVLRVRVEVQ